MDKWTKLATQEVIEKTIKSLKANGISAEVIDSGKEALKRALELIPEGAEVMNTSSRTVDSIGLAKEINESAKFKSVKNELNKLNRETDNLKMQKLGAAPEYILGSVHAVTQDGKVIIASNTGSQFPAYSYGSPNVIWIVGSQKIVKDLDEGLKRIYDYVLKKESERMMGLYGRPSNVSKLLIINKEVKPERLRMIIVKEILGF
ncbi:MAG: hypothetical protein A3I49_00365 [Candidatus Levybacteria bacterium RIFCSPLOWO2_02_FULL_37_11]|nr:MAG: hypothetical protein A3I49_00365 [Candidatus Levybacteria bacterium RIFCSPLOWO2_02_FULL_37_11]